MSVWVYLSCHHRRASPTCIVNITVWSSCWFNCGVVELVATLWLHINWICVWIYFACVTVDFTSSSSHSCLFKPIIIAQYARTTRSTKLRCACPSISNFTHTLISCRDLSATRRLCDCCWNQTDIMKCVWMKTVRVAPARRLHSRQLLVESTTFCMFTSHLTFISKLNAVVGIV